MNRESTGGGIAKWLVGFLGLIALILIGIFVWAALDDEEEEAPDVGVSLSDITSDPEEYYGTSATILGEVNQVVGANAFTIGGEDFVGGEDLLIISATDIPIPGDLERDEPVLADDIVQVSGEVREFNLEDLEDELAVDLDDQIFRGFQGEPAIIAENVRLTPRLSNVPTGAITVESIAENEDVFDGQQVSLNGEVSELVGGQAFLMADASEDEGAISFDERLLVVAAPDTIPENVNEGVPVDVTGTVRLIDEEGEEGAIEEEFGFDIEDGLFDTWSDEPVLIAKSITAGATEATIEIERIVTDAAAYVGTQVTTGGVVEEVLGPQSFVLTAEDDDTVVDVNVLVVGEQSVFPDEVVNDAFVQITGTPHIFDADFKDEFLDDFPFLEDDTFDSYFENGSIVIVAESMTIER